MRERNTKTEERQGDRERHTHRDRGERDRRETERGERGRMNLNVSVCWEGLYRKQRTQSNVFTIST